MMKNTKLMIMQLNKSLLIIIIQLILRMLIHQLIIINITQKINMINSSNFPTIKIFDSIKIINNKLFHYRNYLYL